MQYMFYNCNSLTSLDVSSFDTGNVWTMFCMFSGCTNLTTIYAGNLWNATRGADMFDSCEKLTGGAGTKWSSDHTDHTFAKIDGGESAPGYLTYKATDIVMKGDANGDRKVDKKDIEIVSEYIMTGVEPEGFIWDNADANSDNKVNVIDIVEIVNLANEVSGIE